MALAHSDTSDSWSRLQSGLVNLVWTLVPHHDSTKYINTIFLSLRRRRRRAYKRFKANFQLGFGIEKILFWQRVAKILYLFSMMWSMYWNHVEISWASVNLLKIDFRWRCPQVTWYFVNCRKSKSSVEPFSPTAQVGNLFHVHTCANTEIKWLKSHDQASQVDHDSLASSSCIHAVLHNTPNG